VDFEEATNFLMVCLFGSGYAGLGRGGCQQILKGQQALTARRRCGWLNLQKLYELRLAEQQEGEKIKRTIVCRAAVKAF
jgi:hypothetical protein